MGEVIVRMLLNNCKTGDNLFLLVANSYPTSQYKMLAQTGRLYKLSKLSVDKQKILETHVQSFIFIYLTQQNTLTGNKTVMNFK